MLSMELKKCSREFMKNLRKALRKEKPLAVNVQSLDRRSYALYGVRDRTALKLKTREAILARASFQNVRSVSLPLDFTHFLN